MTELSHCITKRGCIKGKLTRMKTFLDNFDAQTGNLMQIDVRLNSLQTILSEFEDIQSQIESIDASEAQISERENFETSYYNTLAQAKTLLKESTPQLIRPQPPADPQVKLPVMSLPTFSGSYEEYMSFIDTFNSLIHKNKSLDNIQRFFYLRSALKGEAAKLIQSLEATAQNYDIALSLLKDRYDNKEIIVKKQIKSLFEIPRVERESSTAYRRLIDDTQSRIRILKSLNQPTSSWDAMLVYLTASKLDGKAFREWEAHSCGKPYAMAELILFLETKCQVLESVEANKNVNKSSSFHQSSHKPLVCVTTKELGCIVCSGSHKIFRCPTFIKQKTSDRMQTVMKHKLCRNCLRQGHQAAKCQSSSCPHCNELHNSLLHPHDSNYKNRAEENNNESTNAGPSAAIKSYHITQNPETVSNVLLSTALINVMDEHGNPYVCRVLLDSASQANFITETMAQRLKLKKAKRSVIVHGLNMARDVVSNQTSVVIQSRINGYQTSLQCLVVPKISGLLPSFPVRIEAVRIPPSIQLADPGFRAPKKVDLLIGAGLFFSLLEPNRIRLQEDNNLVLQNSIFGWIISGVVPINPGNQPASANCCLTTVESIDANIKRFWELEGYEGMKPMTFEEKICEKHFKGFTKRNDNGQYTVMLPIKENIQYLGNSKDIALKRFKQLQGKLTVNPAIKSQYVTFMDEYLNLGHMQLVEEKMEIPFPNYYLPHHAVRKDTSTTTKLRVVFDASAKSSSNISLNDVLMVGPTIQQDLFSILCRFRKHRYALVADIEKMYRCILVDESQRNLQKIFWAAEPHLEPKVYQLNTLTYGTAPASFLATRCLQQLADDEQEYFPQAAEVVKSDFYMDDLITGADSIERAKVLRSHLSKLCSKGKFHLRKWITNDSKILEGVPAKDIETSSTLHFDNQSVVKTLGLYWKPSCDKLMYLIQTNNTIQISKRSILSQIASTFDPLGLVSPVVVTAKLLMQTLWKLNLGWDDEVPYEFKNRWIIFKNQLEILNTLHVDRCITENKKPAQIQLHGFCDASKSAYGACIYLRCTYQDGNTAVRLLCSKSKVAPIKEITLPRLELCGALLLAQLIHKVNRILNMKIDRQVLWTDSTVVIAWLSSLSSTWKTFVAHRVTEIQELTCVKDWRHVRSQDNPADIISRGLLPEQLIAAKQWWNGPFWLEKEEASWPINQIENIVEIPDKRVMTQTLITLSNDDIFLRYSCLRKLQRVVAWCLRFKNNSQQKPEKRTKGELTVEELQTTLHLLIKMSQQQSFSKELQEWQISQKFSRMGKLSSLLAFVDNSGLLRVGGRLRHADLPPETTHPIILPANHQLTRLIAKHEHEVQFHAGPQALLASLRNKYWPLRGRNLAKETVHLCIRCFRSKPLFIQSVMGDLPRRRVQPARPFLNCAVDYCGPFYIRESLRRGSKLTKSYVAVFICFATKAVHVELVIDLSTQAFLRAFRRFIARRGMCANIYSDNATNFVGAKKEIADLKALFLSEVHQKEVQVFLADKNIKWHMIPPRSPHFGGLWEAAIKSLKYYLRRVLGDAKLTYEEYCTVLCQIEACLNSRPLTPLSNDPQDLSYLSPGHFLIGDTLTALVEPNLQSLNVSRLDRWQRIQQLTQQLWSRWKSEYLSQLQQRSRWKDSNYKIRVGEMVVLRDDNQPPLNWKMARVIQCHPGEDGVTRVVTLRTTNGETRRAVTRVCPLPMDSKLDQEDDVS